MAQPSKSLLYCCYAIAILDLVSVLLFAAVSFRLLIISSHWSAFVLIVFTVFWLCTILLLLVGIWKRRVAYVRAWLVFTIVGVILDALLLLYELSMALTLRLDSLKGVVLPLLGLAVEMTFVYLIFLFYDGMVEPQAKKPRRWCCGSRGKKEATTEKSATKASKSKDPKKSKDKKKKKQKRQTKR